MKNYWLGNLPDSEILSFETEWFANDEDSELLESVRTDLIDDYLSNNLTVAEKQSFEKSFLMNNLDEVVLSKTFVEISKNNSAVNKSELSALNKFLDNIWKFFRVPQVAFASIAIILLVGLGLVYKLNSSENKQIAQKNDFNQNDVNKKIVETPKEIISTENEKPLTNQKENNQIIEKKSKNENTQSVKTKEEKQPEKIEKPIEKKEIGKEEIKAKPVQVLLLTSFRSGVKSLKLSETEKNFDLQLEMPGIDKAYQSYEVRVYDSNQNIVLQQKIKENLTNKKSGQRIIVKGLNTAKFNKQTTYRTALIGIDDKKEAKELNLYDS
ncbi:MAG: hypothetical protein MUF43_08235, partial [Flavobacterium sp.]|nr:hypothetical protein [Flavobacterium sp.]